MGSIAESTVLALLAAAEINSFAFSCSELAWCEGCSLVATVAEGLRLAAPTRTPIIILVLLDFDGEWGFYCDFRLGHFNLSSDMIE